MRFSSWIFLSGLLATAGLTAIFTVISIAENNRPESKPVQLAMRDFSDPHQPSCKAADRIGAIGMVEPAGGVVEIGSDSNGIVREVFVEADTIVRKGALLFRLDDRAALAKLVIRRSELVLAQASLSARHAERVELEEDTRVARAVLEAARAELMESKQLVEMATNLKSFMSVRERAKRQFQMHRASAGVRKAEARLTKALARYSALDPNGDGRAIDVEIAKVAKAQAMVDLGQIEVEILTIKAPSDGMILQLNIHPGEVVAPESAPLILMGSQAQIHVRVDIDATDIVRYSPNEPVHALRRGQQSKPMKLEFVRLEPIVVPKRSLTNRVDERIDTRVLKVIYRVWGAELIPGELLDVFIGKQCSDIGDGRPKLTQR